VDKTNCDVCHFGLLCNFGEQVPTKRITPTQGLRQGDPISPYLFLLCVEVLSSFLSRADRGPYLQEGALVLITYFLLTIVYSFVELICVIGTSYLIYLKCMKLPRAKS
jgi:hypothetical protein